jgi:phosphoglycolate phosphatase
MKLNSSIPIEDIRVLLWDIDGTLLSSKRQNLFMEYTVPTLQTVFGTAGRLSEVCVSGMTDLQIFADALSNEGITPEDIRKRVGDIRSCLMKEIQKVVDANEGLYHLLPGVREALEAIDKDPRYLSTLLTGNMEPSAYLKIHLVGISEFFRLPGAFGDESPNRRELPALAASRINNYLKAELKPSQFIVIGDTPKDIDCARHFGARVLAVGTGRLQTMENLMTYEPDALLKDLSDTKLVMETLAKL